MIKNTKQKKNVQRKQKYPRRDSNLDHEYFLPEKSASRPLDNAAR